MSNVTLKIIDDDGVHFPIILINKKLQSLNDNDKFMERENYASDSPWETKYGYSRAVVIGDLVAVSGTTGTDEKGNAVSDDPYKQAVAALQKIKQILEQAGSSISSVYRYRIYITDRKDVEAVLRAMAEHFQTVKPAATLLLVNGLLNPDMKVEIEVDAIIA